jgi:hypothetical protein
VACWLGLAVLSVSTVLLGNAGATLALIVNNKRRGGRADRFVSFLRRETVGQSSVSRTPSTSTSGQASSSRRHARGA